MKVAVYLRQPAPSNLRDGNLRGEARWERQALEACMMNPAITEVYTAGCHWHSPDTTRKYRGPVGANASDIILLAHDYVRQVCEHKRYKAILLNIFAGPWKEQKPEIDNLVRQYGNNLMFTLGYSILEKGHTEYLQQFLSADNIVVLPVPGIPQVMSTNNFDKKTFLWPYRILVLSAIYQAEAIHWAMKKIQEDPSYNLTIVTSWQPHEYRDLQGDQSVPIGNNVNNYFWSREEIQPYLDIRNNVRILNSITHDQLLNLYAQSKLCLPHYRYFGGPGVEASMYGVPFIGNNPFSAFANHDGYLCVDTEQEQVDLLQKLHTNETYYNEVADGYRQFTQDTYSYEAFNKNFNKIMQERGLA